MTVAMLNGLIWAILLHPAVQTLNGISVVVAVVAVATFWGCRYCHSATDLEAAGSARRH